MGRPDELRARAVAALRRAPYASRLTWSDDTVCRCNVVGPGEADFASARRFATLPDFQSGDFVVFVHPDDPRPGLGETTEFDGGTLELVSWSATPFYTATPVGVARWSR